MSLIAALFLCVGMNAQECAWGLGRSGHIAKPSIVNSHPGGRWSSTKARYGGRRVSSRKAAPLRGQRQLDMPLERCAILAMTGVGVGYLGGPQDHWIGLPAVGVAVAMPFPGQARQGQFAARGEWKRKLLGLFGMSVSYAVGLGVGANMKHTPVD